jgi:hypothetical protein
MRELPERRMESARREQVKVDSGSLIHVDRNAYSSLGGIRQPEQRDVIFRRSNAGGVVCEASAATNSTGIDMVIPQFCSASSGGESVRRTAPNTKQHHSLQPIL